MKLTTLAALSLGLLPFTAMADTIAVDFGNPTSFSSPYTSATYNLGGNLSIIATGYTGSVTSAMAQTTTPLFVKQGSMSGDERGLGLANDPSRENEITPGNFVQLDLSKLAQYGALTFLFKVNSSTAPDAYSIYLSASKGVAGTLYKSGTTESNYSLTAAQFDATPYVSLTATAGNVLLGPGSVTTPEPGTIATLGAGLVLVGLRYRRMRKS